MATAIPFIDETAVAEKTPMPVLIERLREAFAGSSYAARGRLVTEMDDGASLLVMPAWSDQARIGVKLVTVDPRARPSIRSTYLLTDRGTGAPLALFDGTMLTRRRTAAISALAASRLARPGSRDLLLLGTGALIAPLAEAYASAFPLARIRIWGRNRQKAHVCAEAVRAMGLPAEATEELGEALGSCDIVSSATLADEPLIAGATLRPGMHVDLIGAFRRGMREADERAFARSRVFVDTRGGSLEEAGDLIQAIENGFFAPSDIEADLAALCTEEHPGRDGDGAAITLFKSVGTAIADLAAAELVLERCG